MVELIMHAYRGYSFDAWMQWSPTLCQQIILFEKSYFTKSVVSTTLGAPWKPPWNWHSFPLSDRSPRDLRRHWRSVGRADPFGLCSHRPTSCRFFPRDLSLCVVPWAWDLEHCRSWSLDSILLWSLGPCKGVSLMWLRSCSQSETIQLIHSFCCLTT
jgi:hypothetical protein